jgi:AcrR family transcriptional regulator
VFRLPVTHLERPLTYSSPAIQARRKRILDVAFELVAEVGISGFSMDDVGKRANVAKRTLYNAFQTRERMIAVAIGSQFNRFLKRIVYSSPEGTMRHNLERLVSVSERDRKMPHYIAAIMAIYFSHDADEDIRSTLHDMGVAPNLIWIESLHQRGELQPWIDPAKLADDVVRLEYAIINGWCQGVIPAEELTPRLVSTCLSVMAGATQGAARTEILEALDLVGAKGVDALNLPRPKLQTADGQLREI